MGSGNGGRPPTHASGSRPVQSEFPPSARKPCHGAAYFSAPVAGNLQRWGICPELRALDFVSGPLPVFPMTSPEIEWVRDLLGYVQFDCKAELQLQARRRTSLFKLRVQQDEAVGSTKGFESLRRQAHPPITSLPVCEEQPLSKSHDMRPAEAAYHCSCPAAFHFAHAVADDGISVEAKDVIPDPEVPGTQLLVVSFPEAAPASCRLRQATAAVTPETLCRKFTESWFPIWNRDSSLDSHRHLRVRSFGD